MPTHLVLSPQLMRLSLRLSKRLERPQVLPPMTLTRRDVDIITSVERFQFLTSEQIVRLLRLKDPTTSHQHVVRRLNALFAHGLLDRPMAQGIYRSPSDPLVYGVAPDGVRLLSSNLRHDQLRLFAAKKNHRVTASLLLHTLETAEAMIGIEHECTERGLTLLDRSALRPYLPPASLTHPSPFSFSVRALYAGKERTMTVTPDRVFSIAFPNGTRVNALLELDRGTEQVQASAQRKTTIARKHVGYDAAWRTGLYLRQLGFQAVRVLFLTTSHDRIVSMLNQQRALLGDRLQNMFLYATIADFAEHGALAPIWRALNESGVSFIPQMEA